jgi:hypothetical protein
MRADELLLRRAEELRQFFRARFGSRWRRMVTQKLGQSRAMLWPSQWKGSSVKAVWAAEEWARSLGFVPRDEQRRLGSPTCNQSMPLPAVNKNTLDVSQIFLTYLTFGGDVDRTSIAVNLDREIVMNLAKAENWPAKLDQLTKLNDGADSKVLQVQINRAINYVQAHRLRAIVDKVISHLSTKRAEDIVDLFTRVGKNGEPEFSARPLTDLVKAAESCQVMTQRALGDTASERPEDVGEGPKGAPIALQVMAAMNAADEVGLDSVALVRKEFAVPPKATGG